MAQKDLVSPSLEDYLEEILALNEENEKIRVTDLATRMKVAKSSVNQAVNKLVELQMLQHETYGPLILTDLGMERARRVRERHRMLQRFFADILGIAPDIAEQDACRIEHYISQVTMERLVTYVTGLLPKGKR
ncbi:MAG: metal-dependent transcriptional regulator [Bacillota bacterium]